MKLLLDTHIWLWSALEPQRLTRRVDKALVDPANELWLSPVIVGELIVLLRKGRLRLPSDVAAWVALEDLELTEAPLTVDVALAIGSINFHTVIPPTTFLRQLQKCLS